MNECDNGTGTSARAGMNRRALLRGAAWTVPVVAATSVAPLASAATGSVPPGITITAQHLDFIGFWNGDLDPNGAARSSSSTPNCTGISGSEQYDGWIVDGVTITVGDSIGRPVPGVAVTLALLNSGDSKYESKHISFVKTPCDTAAQAWSKMDGSGSTNQIVLTTDASGTIHLDGGQGAPISCGGTLVGYEGTWGYLRHGSDAYGYGSQAGSFGEDVKEYVRLRATAPGYTEDIADFSNVAPSSDPNGDYYYWPGLRPNPSSPCPAPTAP